MRRFIRPGVALAVASTAMLAMVCGAGTAGAATRDPGTVIVVSPTGNDHNPGTADEPLKTLTAAQTKARTAAASGAVTVELQDGTYTLKQPLSFTAADSGTKAAPTVWEAAPGAAPIVSGGKSVTGWSMYDGSKNVYVANVPAGIDSRQLYINGTEAPRAAIPLSRSDVTFTTSGMTLNNTNLAYLATLPEQSRIEVESLDSFTDRYDPVQSISSTAIAMQQPGWQNNNWGYDTLAHPFGGGQMYLENSYSFLQSGQWYLDPTAGKLYYRAPAGDKPKKDDIVLPQLQSLVQMAGTYAKPAHDITFRGIQFSYSTWLSPGTAIGYADQQNGAFIAGTFPQPADYLTSCQSGCPLFEGARNSWHQVPAAVQVAAATRIAFDNNSFTHLGQVALGLGNDPNANASGVGYGVTDTTVHHNLFTDLGGAGVVAGGVMPNAHHPSDPRMTLQNITIDNNLVTDVAKDYKEMSGILSTYANHTVISHNEVSNLAYDGIDVGWGWGSNDPGGSQDYANRGLYAYQPVYTTPTTLKNTVISDNVVHGTKKVFHDGGSIYNLSANPGAQVSGNYIYDNLHTVGLYLDEGSRYVTESSNVIQDSGVWVFTNASGTNNTSDNVLQNNWYNAGVAQTPGAAQHNNQLIGNIQVSGTNWPLDAQRVIYNAGIQANLRTFADATVPTPVGLGLTASATTVAPGATITVTATVVNFSTAKVNVTDTPGLTLPAGWSATVQKAMPNQLTKGQSAVASWTVKAPATGTGTATITETLAAVQAGVSYPVTQQLTVTLAPTS